MKSNFEECLSVVLRHEGGWSDHPSDPGGATMRGITLATYSGYLGRPATKGELRAISEAHLREIYRCNYWDAVRGDDLPIGIDLIAFDGAVNSGPARGAKWVQSALGVAADGKVGPATVGAAKGADYPPNVVKLACGKRMDFLRGLSTWKTFGKGWTARVNDVEDRALSMISAAAKAPEPSPRRSFWQFILDLLKGAPK